MMQSLEDAELVKMACGGDARAFELLVERHYDLIFRIAFKWCRNRPDAEDITQEACIKLARAIESFTGQAAFSSWLYRVVINTAIDWQRSKKAGKFTALAEDESGFAGVSPPEAESRMIARETLRQVDALPEKEKTALLLVFAEGMSHAEAAFVMECKESTVSWHIHEARKKLGVKDGKKERHHG